MAVPRSEVRAVRVEGFCLRQTFRVNTRRIKFEEPDPAHVNKKPCQEHVLGARLKLWQKRTRSSKMELRSKLALVVMKLHHAVLIEKQGARVIFHHFPLQRHCIKGEVVKKLKDIVIRAAVAADFKFDSLRRPGVPTRARMPRK